MKTTAVDKIDPDDGEKCFVAERKSKGDIQAPAVQLHSVLSNRRLDLSGQHALSSKQRFEVAAAVTWAVLLLCGTSWVTEWSDRDMIQLMSEKGPSTTPGAAKHAFPTMPHVFCRSQPEPGPAIGSPTPVERFQSAQIRNKALFALGILLVELCLNRTFETLRQEHRSASLCAEVGQSSSYVDDYALAQELMDDVYLEAGDSYGHAVQRCLRCEFPELRDAYKNFDIPAFRKHFFNGVVAPVQAVYKLHSVIP